MKKKESFNELQKRHSWTGSVLLTLLLLFFNLHLNAQQKTITGTLKDASNGNALVGATVSIKGTTNGTISDLSGSFSLTAESPGKLIISYVGYLTAEVDFTPGVNLSVNLEPEFKNLEEIVVVGYGTQKRINISGAADQLDSKQLESRPISSISQGLQGAVPNLNIDYNSGEPGAVAKINIRGITSINEGEPLILIDGVPSESSDLNRIAPEDVESISVLKDASSAAIYGARAAFGVIMLNTKTGSSGKTGVQYSNSFSWSKATTLPDKITDPYIYLRLLETSTNNTPWDNVNYSDETYSWAKQRSDDPSSSPAVRVNPNDATSWEYMGNRDWTYYFLNDQTFSQKHHFSINGGNDMASYYLGAGYDRQSGVINITDDFYDRYSLRSKVNFTPLKNVTIGNNTLYTNTRREMPSQFDMWTLYNFFPTDYDKNPDGTWSNTEVGRMGAKLTDGGRTDDNYDGIQSTFTSELSLIEEVLKVNGDFTFKKGISEYEWYTTKYNIGYGPDDVREEGYNDAYRSLTNENYNAFNLYATFDQKLGENHQIVAIAGFNQEYNRYEWFKAERDNVISASLPTIALATGESVVDEYIREWAIRGAFYRLNYFFRDRYIIEFNGRYDGSSRFPSEKRFGFFPSASAAWRIDRESFMSSMDKLSNLKARVSYGSLGNQQVSEYGYIPSMNAGLSNYIIGSQLPQRVLPPQLVSANYSWEVVNTLNFGLDLGMFENRIFASFDMYTRDTKDMLTQGKELPGVLGANEPNENAADLRTKGWELSVGYKNNFTIAGKPAFFDTRFILSDSRTEITRFDNPNKNLIQYYEGKELGEIWGLESDGLFANQTEIDALDESEIIPWGALSIVPGWPKYKDLDESGSIQTGLTVDDPKDLKVIGNISPRYRVGLNLNLNWNGFDIRAIFQGILKRDYYPQDYLYWGFYQQPYAGGYDHLLDFYRPGDDSDVDKAKHSASYINAGLADANLDSKYPILQAWLADRNLGERVDQAKGLAIPQTDYMLNAAYVRFKNLTVGYTLPASLSSRINATSFRIFISGENLYEWSQVKDYFDPEAINDVTYKYDPSADPDRLLGKGYSYPYQRRYSIGINVNF